MSDEKQSSLARIPPVLVVAVTVIATLLVAYLIFKPRASEPEVIVERVVVPAEETVEVYTGEVIDATKRGGTFTVEEGHRYKVLIDSTATDSTAGIAHIGGLVTFVQGGSEGDIAIIEVTRKKRTVAEAIVIEVVGKGSPAAVVRKALEVRRPSPVEVGKTYRARVTDVGKKGDGIIHVGGKVVFVPGVKQGEDISVRIVEDRPNFARGEAVSFHDASAETEPFQDAPVVDATDSSLSEVKPGARFDVEITEKDRRTPDTDGVARIDGLVVFVAGTQPGDKCTIEITERAARFARAKRVE